MSTSVLFVKDANATTQSVLATKDALNIYAMHHRDGIKIVAAATPTITASSAYAAGNVVGGVLAFTGAVRGGDAMGGIIHSVVVLDKSNSGLQYDLLFFDNNPTTTGSTITDKTNLTLVSATLLTALGGAQIAQWIAASTGGAVGATLPDLRFVLATGTTLYAVLIARGAPTFASTSDITVRLLISQD